MPKRGYGHNVKSIPTSNPLTKSLLNPVKNILLSRFVKVHNSANEKLTMIEYDKLHGYRKNHPDNQLDRNVFAAFDVYSDMEKDAKNAFKPYKNWWDMAGNLMQPVKGMANLLLGTSILILAALVILAGLALITAISPIVTLLYIFIGIPIVLREIFTNPEWQSAFAQTAGIALPYFRKALKAIEDMSLGITWSINRCIRGITQITFTPALLVEIPVRLLITAVKGFTKIEEGEKVKDYVKQGRELVQIAAESHVYDTTTMCAIMKKLNRKLHSGLAQFQASEINFHEVKYQFDPDAENITAEKFSQFLNLFEPKPKNNGGGNNNNGVLVVNEGLVYGCS